jgi:hypothetical protein
VKRVDSGSGNTLRLLQQLGQKSLPPTTPASTKAPQTPSTTQTQTPSTTMPSLQTAASTQVLMGLVSSPSTKAPTRATQALGVTQGALFSPNMNKLASAIRAATVGFALLCGTPLLAMADTVFLDHNNAPKEVAVAKQLAASKGEKFILVRPDAQALDALFARAEKGEVDLRHLIFSGHSSGTRVWGDGGDGVRHETSIDEFKAMKAKYPKAFAQVKHIHFMACYAGSAGNSAQWSAVFPGAKIAGFWGSGPSKEQPAAHAMLKNSELTMRALDSKSLSPQQAMIAAKQMANAPGSNVTKFAVRLPTNDGVSVHFSLGEQVTPMDVASDRVNVLRLSSFEPYMNPVGQAAQFASPPTTHSTSPLRAYYNALHSYLNALPADDYRVKQTQGDIDTTIRLIYFDVIQQKMQTTHGATFAAADSALKDAGVSVQIGDVSKLSRLQIVELAKQLGEVGELQWAKFDTKNAADLALVNPYLKAAGKDAVRSMSEKSSSWEGRMVASQLENDIKDAPADVKAAGERIIKALGGGATAFSQAKKLVQEGLKDLSPSVVPSTWIE